MWFPRRVYHLMGGFVLRPIDKLWQVPIGFAESVVAKATVRGEGSVTSMESLASEVAEAMWWVSDELELLAEDGRQTPELVSPPPPSPPPQPTKFRQAVLLLPLVA